MSASSRRVRAVTRKVFATLRHDKRSLGLMLVAPVLAMAVFGFAFGTEVEHVPVVVVNQDEGDLAAEVVANLDPVKLATTTYTSRQAAERDVLAGKFRGMLFFPTTFTADASPSVEAVASQNPVPVGSEPQTRPVPPKGTNLTVFLDASNSQMSAVVLRAVAEALQETAEEGGAVAPIEVATTYAYGEGARYIDFFVPGIMAFAALNFTVLLTLLAFVAERTRGTLSRLLAGPVKEWEIVAGYTAAFGAIAALQGVILLTVAIVVFDVLVVGSVVLAFFTIVLMALNAMSLGILLSAAARSELQAIQMFPVIVFPTFLLSGIFVPTETLPAWLKPLAYLIPPTYAVEALRNVMLRGWGIFDVWPQLLALIGFATAFLAVAVVGLKRQRA